MTMSRQAWFLLVAIIAVASYAQEFDFQVGSSNTSACVRFRMNSSYLFSDLQESSITKQSAVLLCKSFSPTSTTGTFGEKQCYKYASYQVMSSDLHIDCPYNAKDATECNITGPTVSDGSSVGYFYGAALHCVVPDFESKSTVDVNGVGVLTVSGSSMSYRTITVTTTTTLVLISPSYYFPSGSICVRSDMSEDPNVPRSICRTAGMEVTAAGFSVSTAPMSNFYISNIKCPSTTNTGTLWDGCTYDTTIYNASSMCGQYAPKVTCYESLRMQLGPVIRTGGSAAGLQRVMIGRSGFNTLDGDLCSSISYYRNISGAVCGDMYPAGGYDFAASYLNTTTDSSSAPIYLSRVECDSSATSLASCTGFAYVPAKAKEFNPSCPYRGVVACKMNEYNTRFSLERTSTTSTDPGVGYLMAAVTATGQAAASVCSNGFNDAAIQPACRSLGYTPGPNAYYRTTSVKPSSYTINNVTCNSGANKLMDCTLRYSGIGHKLSTYDAQQCNSRVLLNCDLGVPTAIEFRVTPSPYYLQTRLYADAEWGWVGKGPQLDMYYATKVMCGLAYSRDGDVDIQASYMNITGCSSTRTFSECSRAYTNGYTLDPSMYIGCDSSDLPAAAPSSPEIPVNKDLLYGFIPVVGAACFIIVSVSIGVYCMKKRRAERLDLHRRSEASLEMIPKPSVMPSPYSNGPAAPSAPPMSDFYASHQQGMQGTPQGQDIYGQASNQGVYGQSPHGGGGDLYATHTTWNPNASGQHENTGFSHL